MENRTVCIDNQNWKTENDILFKRKIKYNICIFLMGKIAGRQGKYLS